MGFGELMILAVGVSMDAFAVSICKGLAMQKATLKEGLICGGWFGGFQAIMPLIGFFLGTLFADAIESIEYRTDLATGIRTSGFGSARLQMGFFTNGELGTYTRYGYTKATDSIHILCNDAHLVIALKTPAETQALYETLLTKLK